MLSLRESTLGDYHVWRHWQRVEEASVHRLFARHPWVLHDLARLSRVIRPCSTPSNRMMALTHCAKSVVCCGQCGVSSFPTLAQSTSSPFSSLSSFVPITPCAPRTALFLSPPSLSHPHITLSAPRSSFHLSCSSPSSLILSLPTTPHDLASHSLSPTHQRPHTPYTF